MKYRRGWMAVCTTVMLLAGMVLSLSVSAEPVAETEEDIPVVVTTYSQESSETTAETTTETTTEPEPTDEFGNTLYAPPPSAAETTTTITTSAPKTTTTTTTTTTATTTTKTTYKTIKYNPEHPEDNYTGALWAGRVIWPWEKTSKGQTEATVDGDDLYFDEDYTDNHAADYLSDIMDIPFEDERGSNWLIVAGAGVLFLIALAAVIFMLMKGKTQEDDAPPPPDDMDRFGPANPFYIAPPEEEADDAPNEDLE